MPPGLPTLLPPVQPLGFVEPVLGAQERGFGQLLMPLGLLLCWLQRKVHLYRFRWRLLSLFSEIYQKVPFVTLSHPVLIHCQNGFRGVVGDEVVSPRE